jgi:small multidrug resistance pump
MSLFKSFDINHCYLGFAIVAEVIGTSALKAAAGFTRPLAVIIVASGYVSAFYLLSLALRTIPISIAYAIWSGLGIVLASVAARILYGQTLDAPALMGIGLILIGVVVINTLSQISVH